MAYDPATTAAFTAEAQKLQAQIAFAKAEERFAVANHIYRVTNMQVADAQQRLNDARTRLEAAIVNADSVSDDFGELSFTDKALRVERLAGWGAAVDLVKAAPSTTQLQAGTAWNTAALATRPADQQYVLQDIGNMLKFIQRRALDLDLVPQASWAALATYIQNTDKALLLALV